MAIMRLTARQDVPHEPGEWFEFRRLGWRHLDAARSARSTRQMHLMRDMGGELMTAVLNQETTATATAAADPLTSYDQAALLAAGIAGWSYAEPVTPEALDALDETTAEWAARAILTLALPSTGVESKNGSSPSTSS